jgi:hypothetical protein
MIFSKTCRDRAAMDISAISFWDDGLRRRFDAGFQRRFLSFFYRLRLFTTPSSSTWVTWKSKEEKNDFFSNQISNEQRFIMYRY